MSHSVLEVLETGTINIEARFTNSSNNTMLVTVALEDEDLLAVYKPEEGERPLWDFPQGLWRREIAAYRLSEFLDLGLVPETVERIEAPFGPGSLQRYVNEGGEHHFFTLRDEPRHKETFLKIAAFDWVANNSDRKSGHVLQEGSRLWCIDHGLCFHEEAKLRTVIWDFAGEPLSVALNERISALRDAPPSAITDLLSGQEADAMVQRADDLITMSSLPFPDEDGPYPPYPWPLV